VVAVSVSNESAIDREGRVDVEISGWAVQSGFENFKERHMLIVLRRITWLGDVSHRLAKFGILRLC
jgi:hypothetical protein